MNSDLINKLQSKNKIHFKDIINYSSLLIPEDCEFCDNPASYFRSKDPKNPQNKYSDNRGTKPIDSDLGVLCYLTAFGKMHQGKMNIAFEELEQIRWPKILNIVDWGCGQGLATFALIEYLEKHHPEIEIDHIILIEPSKISIEYAEKFIGIKTKDSKAKIKVINKFFDELTVSDFNNNWKNCTFHLYSNILDVDHIDMKLLSSWLYHFRSCENYIISASPKYYSGDVRIDTFFSYLKGAQILADLKESNKVDNDKNVNFTYNIKIERLDALNTNKLKEIKNYAPRQFFASYLLDIFQNKDNKQVRNYSKFYIYAPYEIGTSYMDDVDPIYAVLSNIISRGIPTKASPFVEESIAEVYKNSVRQVQYGTVKYASLYDEDKIQACHSCLENEDLHSEDSPLIYTPIAVARIQKTIVEALITGHLSIEDKVWDVLVVEHDVPCAALAFKDLEQLFTHLVSLSENYSDRHFPQVNLHVINPNFSDSPLHLDAKVYADASGLEDEEFNLVIECSNAITNDFVPDFNKYNCTTDCHFILNTSAETISNRYFYTTDLICYRPLLETELDGTVKENPEMVHFLEYLLQLLFRKESFRMGQIPILNRALRNKSVIGLLPTGGGKSLTYQLAALMQPGITLVIDPLKSLMKDQFDGLRAACIDCCNYINSKDKKEERAKKEYQLERSRCLITFMSPERLAIYTFRKRLHNMHESNVYFAYGVIDEVHCVSEWGQDFRFTYLHLGRNLYNFVKAKNGNVSLFGLTATASFDVLADVERELSGENSYELDSDVLVRCEDTNRLELQYKVIPVALEYKEDKNYDKRNMLPEDLPKPYSINSIAENHNKSDYLPKLLKEIPSYVHELLKKENKEKITYNYYTRQNKTVPENLNNHLDVDFPDNYNDEHDSYEQGGIIFCPHKGKTQQSVDICLDKVRDIAPKSGYFYAIDSDKEDKKDAEDKLDKEEKEKEVLKNMVDFRDNQLSLMVATKAFGMGIDKPNVRFTINLNYSNSLEAFVQEAGRAGRDQKMALSLILVSDYNFIRINWSCSINKFPIGILKGHWFKENDLDAILDYYDIHLNKQKDCTLCNPKTDLVKLTCHENTKAFWNKCNGCKKENSNCKLKELYELFPGWGSYQELLEDAQKVGLELIARNIVYQSPDYNTMYYFYTESYPGTEQEMSIMESMMESMEISTFIGDTNKESVDSKVRKGFLDFVLHQQPETDIVCLIKYDKDSSAAFSKAIYRMCCIGLIDDFTIDYSKQTYRIVCRRKNDGDYYEHLKYFLRRYYTEQKAALKVEEAKKLEQKDEIHNCLYYLTLFIYENLAVKKKRAIDDIRTFCNIGLQEGKDWTDVNEELKDYIYYYFNSKYAKSDYIANNGEPYSLTSDTDYGKDSPLDIVWKYMKVGDDEICGSTENPNDNIKHLQGAVRIISRAFSDNPVIELLNVFCIMMLGEYKRNKAIRESLEIAYAHAYRLLWHEFEDRNVFYAYIRRFKNELFERGADRSFAEQMELIESTAEVNHYTNFLKNLKWENLN